MSVLFIILPLAIVLAVLALAGFAWSIKQGQMDDLDSPPVRMLFDDTPTPAPGSPGSRPPASTTVEQTAQRNNA